MIVVVRWAEVEIQADFLECLSDGLVDRSAYGAQVGMKRGNGDAEGVKKRQRRSFVGGSGAQGVHFFHDPAMGQTRRSLPILGAGETKEAADQGTVRIVTAAAAKLRSQIGTKEDAVLGLMLFVDPFEQ